MDGGLLEEAKTLLTKYPKETNVFSSIGYRQLIPLIQGAATLTDAVKTIARDTRHYARRQLTWFKKEKYINWLPAFEEAEALVSKFIKTL